MTIRCYKFSSFTSMQDAASATEQAWRKKGHICSTVFGAGGEHGYTFLDQNSERAAHIAMKRTEAGGLLTLTSVRTRGDDVIELLADECTKRGGTPAARVATR